MTKSASATLTDGDATITLLFTFDDRGLVSVVSAQARSRSVGAEIVPTPWRGRFWNYEKRDGMTIPTDGEVAWLPPEGEKTYWRGHITSVSYEFVHQD